MPASMTRLWPRMSPRPLGYDQRGDGKQIGQHHPLHLLEGGGEGPARAGRATLAMLVPSDDRSMASERARSARPGFRSRNTSPAGVAPASAFSIRCIDGLRGGRESGRTEQLGRIYGFRDAQHLHLIRASDAIYNLDHDGAPHVAARSEPARHSRRPARRGQRGRAARRLQLSPSAMSRALARLREATGDPLLVRAGRGLVPTPRALELGVLVGEVVESPRLLRPAERLDLAKLARTFTLRTSDGFVDTFGPALIERVRRGARVFGCASCRSRTRKAPACATPPSTLRPASSDPISGRKSAPRLFSATALSASCGPVTRFAEAKSRWPAMRRPARPRVAARPGAGTGRRSAASARSEAQHRHRRRRLFHRARAGAGVRSRRHGARAAYRSLTRRPCTASRYPSRRRK